MENKIYNLTKRELNNEKNKVIARFASIASHDLKNSLGGLSNISYYFSNVFKIEGDVPNKMLALLSSEVTHLNQLIVELLDKTRVKQITKGVCNLKQIMEQAIENSIAEKITFNVNLIPADVYGDKDKLTLAFFNIIKNAKDAMAAGGVIDINMEKVDNKMKIKIKDTGIGMDSQTLENCFDPMFSTKTAKAMGMGLTVAQQVIEAHDGTIDINSRQNEGTTVTVTIPVK
jgi:two-component system, sporulation sensor kinase E